MDALVPHAALDSGAHRSAALGHTLVAGVASGVVFKLGMKALVMPLLGAPPLNDAYGYLAGNAAAIPGIVATVLVSAAFSEELVYRGICGDGNLVS